MPEPDDRLPPPPNGEFCFPPDSLMTLEGMEHTKLYAIAMRRSIPAFNVWHRFRNLPEAYRKDARQKVALYREKPLAPEYDAAVDVCFIRQGNFTLCVLACEVPAGERHGEPIAYGMAKRNMRVATRPGKGPERESAQAGQRAVLGRAVDAWLRGKLAWTRPRHKEA